jgi:hypothetical protein
MPSRSSALEQRLLPRAMGGLVLSLVALSCSISGVEPRIDDSATASIPVVTPTAAYKPFYYMNDAQRRTFQAFLTCAEDHGIDYDGPFTDSTGNGIYLRLAEDEHATHAQQDEVSSSCPQFDVATFGTPVGRLHSAAFEKAASAFARCVRSHGSRRYPLPDFRGNHPVDTFWHLPFDWASDRFTSAVKACVDPLKGYLFGG